MDKVVITGAAGFIGSNLVGALLDKGYQVVGLDNLSQGFLRNLEQFLMNPNFTFVQADVRDEASLHKIVQGAGTIVHLASYKIPRYGNAYDTLTINVKGSENVLKAALDNGKCKLIFSSTSDVYGKNPQLPFSEKTDFHIGVTTVKRWSYAVSKLIDEHLCFAYQKEYGLPISIIRYFGGYGPKQNLTWWGGPQSVFIACALEDRPMPVHGDGLQTRSFTYVSDLVDGTVEVMEKDQALGEVFNIGYVKPVTIIELAKTIWRLIRGNESPKIEIVSYRSFSGRYEDVRNRVPDITKAQTLLGFEPKVDLEHGLITTIKWQKDIMKKEGAVIVDAR